MATEVTATLRFEGLPPVDFERVLEDEFECIVVEYDEEEDI